MFLLAIKSPVCGENVKVVKFGGSSLADAAHFKQVRDIILADPTRRFVVPSAPGKRFPGDSKVTDMLYDCYTIAASGGNFDEAFSRITARYVDIIDGLGLTLDLSDEFESIKSAIRNHAGRDFAASRGEYLNGIVLAAYLGFDFIDAASVICFADNGTFDARCTNTLLSAELAQHKCAVIPGFYGSMPNGTLKTFSRGGSDITGSIVARASEAALYENWTDVSGFLMADPRIIPSPLGIKTITYRELRELSYMGATVLHEDSIFPVRFAGIPINIRNTNEPEAPGTMILPTSDEFDTEHIITGIAGKKGFCVVNIEKDMMNSEVGFGRKVLEVLEHEGVCFEHLPSGIDTMSIVLNETELEGHKDRIVSGICRTVDPDSVSIESGLALLAVVGRGMVKTPGTAARVFSAIANAGINIKMIDQGSSELSIIVAVAENELEKALRAIYAEFVKA